MTEIDPIEFGRLTQAVENLTVKVDQLSKEMSDVKNNFHGARGVAIGMLLAAGGVGAGAAHVFDKLFK